ncbi:MAG: helix-turn-helix transcriptional regulator [Kiritimatiellae bacterium]|nr:helix-turn-helix transcriptional regulator [Kiritimatiellia bacterium]
MQEFRRGLGQAIRNRRKALRLSQEQLAERLDMHRNYISLVERGIQNITVETLYKLTVALDCSPADLFTEAAGSVNAPPPSVSPAPATVYPPPRPPVWRVAESEPRP